MLYHLGYVSTQTDAMTPDDLLALLNQAHAKNSALHITGVLLHREDSFFQVLEGEEADVRALFDKIRRDPRHQRIEVLFEGEIDAREFPDWRMSFIELDGVDVSKLPGFSGFLRNDAEPRRLFEGLTQSRRLMLLFRAMK
jgi:hypothetical protein